MEPRTDHQGNALPAGASIGFAIKERSAAAPDVVFDLLADVRRHVEWGGRRQSKHFRLTSLDAPPGPANVGTEFSSTGVAPDGAWRDSSVVTEAQRPSVFEFVTEGEIGDGDDANTWTFVHRYQIDPSGSGSQITYTSRVTSIERLGSGAKMLLRPVVGRVLLKINARFSRKGVRALARMAEEGSR